jgi:transcription-repair coupling factor (superfamily II helicase)
MLDEAVSARSGDGGADEDGGASWEPVRIEVPVDAYIPPAYIPYEVAKIDVHRRIAAAREPADLEALAEELADRFGPPPEPVENLIRLQRARIRLAPSGARVADVRGETITISPLVLDSAASRLLREELGQAVYQSLQKTLRVRIPEEELDRLGALLRVADALAKARAAAPSGVAA